MKSELDYLAFKGNNSFCGLLLFYRSDIMG